MLYFFSKILQFLILNVTLSTLLYSGLPHPSTYYLKPVINVSINNDRNIGSGFIISKDGLIISNDHVINGIRKEELYIHLYNKIPYKAEVVYRWQKLDIAILKIKDLNFKGFPADHVAELGDSDNLHVAQEVLAIGSSKGFRHTFTQGHITGLHRNLEPLPWNIYYDNLIQIALAVNKGNSGGPVITTSGKIVGIISLKLPGEDLGFAIPINLAKRALANYKKKIFPHIIYSGLSFRDVNYDEVWELNLTKGNYVAVSQVALESPAYKAGIKHGDIILEVEGKEPWNPSTARGYIMELGPEDILTLKIARENKTFFTKVKLMTTPEARKLGLNLVGVKQRPVILPPILLPPGYKNFDYPFKWYK